MPRQTVRVAAVDGPDQQHLSAVAVFDWDRSYDLVDKSDRKAPALLRRLGLKRYPDRWVDVTERPDIAVGEPFPFHPRPEAEASA